MQIKGILFDIGGVLYVGDKPINGAIETIFKIKTKYPVRFITNSTQKPPQDILKKLTNLGFNIKEQELFTALKATEDFLKQKNATIYPILTNRAKEYFKNYISNEPDFVLIGDAQDNFNYKNLNKAFRYLINGSNLIAAAKIYILKIAIIIYR